MTVNPADTTPVDTSDALNDEQPAASADVSVESAQDPSIETGRVGGQLSDADDADEWESTSTLSLFEGDEGGLLFAQRQALVQLVRNPFISAQTHPREWRALIENPGPIRSRLNDMFMVLELDTQREVAFKRQATPEGGGRRFPTLFYDQAWQREETIVLVFLRMRFHTEQAAGDGRAFTDRDDIHDYVAQFRPAHATDKAADRGRVERAIDKIYKTGLLLGRKTADRFEIARAIEVLIPLDTLTDLLAWLRGETGADASPGPTTPNPTDPGSVVDSVDGADGGQQEDRR